MMGRTPFRRKKSFCLDAAFIKDAYDEPIKDETAARLKGASYDGRQKSGFAAKNESFCQIIAYGGNDPRKERGNLVAAAKKRWGL